MANIYRYVLMSDGGMAPNPRGSILSLATCKPVIRATAKVGDWVIANRPSPHNNLVVWAGKIAQVLSPDIYSDMFPHREDALYRRADDGILERIPGLRTWYHPSGDQQRRDMHGQVLLFEWNRCRYFGDEPQPYPERLEHLAARGQGHRKNGASDQDAAALELWLTAFPSGAIGKPRDGWEGRSSAGCGPAARGCGPAKKPRAERRR